MNAAGAGPAHRDLGRWILGREIGPEEDPGALWEAAERVCQKLYLRLARLVTTAGSQAFLARSLHLARAEFPALDGLHAGALPDACLPGVADVLGRVEQDEAREALAAVFAHMFGLLVTFIGEDLARHALRDIWPDAPLMPAGRQEEQS